MKRKCFHREHRCTYVITYRILFRTLKDFLHKVVAMIQTVYKTMTLSEAEKRLFEPCILLRNESDERWSRCAMIIAFAIVVHNSFNSFIKQSSCRKLLTL
jgi:hypothetical protein